MLKSFVMKTIIVSLKHTTVHQSTPFSVLFGGSTVGLMSQGLSFPDSSDSKLGQPNKTKRKTGTDLGGDYGD